MPKVINNYAKARDIIVEGSAILTERAANSHVVVSQQLAPVKTGFLRDNISAEQIAAAAWLVISAALYSVYVEFDQPFFLPGYESAQRQLREEAARLIAGMLVAARIK